MVQGCSVVEQPVIRLLQGEFITQYSQKHETQIAISKITYGSESSVYGRTQEVHITRYHGQLKSRYLLQNVPRIVLLLIHTWSGGWLGLDGSGCEGRVQIEGYKGRDG